MTGRRLVRRPLSWGVVSRLEHPEGVALAIVMAALAAVGWYASPFWLAVAIAGQLVLGGLGAVWIIGPATSRIGFARYATLAVSGVSLTMPDGWETGIGLLLPIVAVPAVRAAESRRRYGAEAIGQALLHLLAIAQ